MKPDGPSPFSALAKIVLGRASVPDFMLDLAEQYPRVAYVNFGIDKLYILNDAELARTFFVERSSKVWKSTALKNYSPLLGNGLLTNEGESWRDQRRLVQPGFHRERVVKYGELIVDRANALSDSWRDKSHLDVSAEMAKLTLTIVVQALFGDGLDNQAESFAASLTDVLSGSGAWMLPGGHMVQKFPTPAHNRMRKGTAYLDKVVADLVADRTGQAPKDDVLSMLLEAEMSNQQVRDEVMTLILAGHETTAMALTWAWMLLAHNPSQLERLHAEVDGRSTLTIDDMQTLPFTRAVFAEALRLYPPAWLMGRTVVDEFELDHLVVPKGATVVVVPYALQRSNTYWGDGSVFRPDRWLNADGAFDDQHPGQPNGAWLPFGMGQRKCVGQTFAWAEGVLILATLAKVWDVDVTSKQQPRLVPAITLRPRGGMPARLIRRAASA